MKASRAYITGLGTTGVLLCFAMLLLVVVSAIVTFRGWPAGTAGDDSTAAVRIDADRSTSAAPVRREVTAARRAANAGAARSAARVKRPSRHRGSVHGVSESGTRASGQTLGAPEQAPAPAPQPQNLPKAPQAPDVGHVSNGLADTSGQVTQGAAGALGDLGLTPLDQTVSNTGQAGSDVVQQTGDATHRALPRLR